MKLRLRRENVGPLAHEIGRQAERQIARQRDLVEIEIGRRPMARRLARQHRERMARDIDLLAQGRQQGVVARELAARGLDVELGRDAGPNLALDEAKIGLVVGDDALDGRDLAAQRGDGEQLDHRVAGEGEIGGVQLEILCVGEGAGLLDGAARAAEDVERVAHRRADPEEIGIRREGRRQFRQPELGAVDVLARRAGADIDLGIEPAHRLVQRFLRRDQRRLGAGERAAAGDRLLEHGVERLGAIERPPIAGDLLAHGEMLVAGALLRRPVRAVGRIGGRRGPQEIGTDGAGAHQPEQRQQRQFRALRHRGRSDCPIRNSSTARAHCRPSRIAQTTSDCPRRASPAANTLPIEVR